LAKLPEQFGFAIEYTGSAANLRYYEPDFVALTTDGVHHIVEAEGLEDVSVANKERAARLWCQNTTRLTGKPWTYLNVLQTEFDRLQPWSFSELSALGAQDLA
jgi:type III restriction enzyme